jgi:hypothetical protein
MSLEVSFRVTVQRYELLGFYKEYRMLSAQSFADDVFLDVTQLTNELTRQL